MTTHRDKAAINKTIDLLDPLARDLSDLADDVESLAEKANWSLARARLLAVDAEQLASVSHTPVTLMVAQRRAALLVKASALLCEAARAIPRHEGEGI